MIEISSIYEDVAKDNANTNENGTLSYARFNRMSKRAELRMIDWLSGDISGITPPEPYITQKNKDWLSPFIVKVTDQALNGVMNKPSDYYGFENMYRLGLKIESDCEGDDDVEIDEGNTVITLLDGQKFNKRVSTRIEEKKPSLKLPIAKLVGGEFQFSPKHIGSVGLEYIRYPKYGKIISKMDVVYNQEVVDESLSINYEWDEYARELLVWFITDTFAMHTSNSSLKAANNDTKKTVRG